MKKTGYARRVHPNDRLLLHCLAMGLRTRDIAKEYGLSIQLTIMRIQRLRWRLDCTTSEEMLFRYGQREFEFDERGYYAKDAQAPAVKIA